MTRKAGILTARLGIGTLAVGAVTAFAHAGTPPTSTAYSAAPTASTAPAETTVAVHALTTMTAETALTYIPAAFSDHRGYVPTVRDGVLLDPGGDCSSPVPLPDEFDIACMQHDLGYDMLRFGAETGHRAAPQARVELDTQLGESMHRACADRTSVHSRLVCNAAADIAVSAVRVNSWRQQYDAPRPEPTLPFVLAVVGGIGVGGAALARALSPARREVTS